VAGDDRFAGGALAKFSFSLVVCYGVGFVSKSLFATWICNRSFNFIIILQQTLLNVEKNLAEHFKVQKKQQLYLGF